MVRGTDRDDDLLTEVDSPEDDGARGGVPGDEESVASTKRVQGWGRVFRGNRALWIGVIIALVSLVAGLLVGRFVVAPADAAGASAPDPGLITVPVAFGPLSNDVTIRGEIAYADATQVTFDTSSISGAAVVTGQVPEVGAELNALSIALEVAGRPVIVLPGDLPSYRSLMPGVSGPDVVQLKQSLASVGIDAGDPASDVYDDAAARGVAELYAQAGYPLPAPDDGAKEALRAAEESVRSGREAVTEAESALGQAQVGPSAVDIRMADNEVAAIRRELAAAENSTEQEPVDIEGIRDRLAVAEMQRQQLDAPKDTSGERAAIDAARAQLADAQEALATAQRAVLPHLPASEVLYLPSLPRRVDSVEVKRGSILQGAAMTVSGATVRMTGSVSAADAALLTAGDEASFELPDGQTHAATVTTVEKGSGSDGRWKVVLEPAPLTPEQSQQIQGTNVRVSIPVGATDGDVLSVPLAALTAGPGGEPRVEVAVGDPREVERAETRLVTVKTGLAAKGAVEVTPVEGELAEGDRVVVGR